MEKQKIKTTGKFAVAIALLLNISQFSNAKLHEIQDEELHKITGQSLFNLSYVAPTEKGNVSGLGFYTLGLEGTIELNANIKKLQLGCGGINGADLCDIDLEQVRITGPAPGPSGTYVDSDALLNNPFIQFAVKNPSSASTRSIVGLAVGAQKVNGLLSIGTNPTPHLPGTPGGIPGGETGINVISGRIPVQVSNVALSATLCTTTVGSSCLLPLGSGNLPLLNTSITPKNGINQPGGVFSSLVSGNRITSLNLGPFALDAQPLNGFGGILVSALGGVAYGSLAENFIDVHNLNINSTETTGVLLTFNQQEILWPQIGSSGIMNFPQTSQYTNSNGSPITPDMLMAQKGWYLLLPTTTIGGKPNDPLITSNVLLGVLNSPSALEVLSLPGITIPSINLNQIPVQNCYGNLKFC